MSDKPNAIPPRSTLFNACGLCRACCRSTDGSSASGVGLTDDEQKRLNHRNGNLRFNNCRGCEYLSHETGCTLSWRQRPFLCRIFPLIVVGDKIGVDVSCPIAQGLVASASAPDSPERKLVEYAQAGANELTPDERERLGTDLSVSLVIRFRNHNGGG